MEYQLILQFNEDVFSFDEMISFEDKLEKNLKGLADVDGHDSGSGEINFFIFTNNPKEIFNKLQSEIIDSDLKVHLRAAFRQIQDETYSTLWPKNLTEFAVI